MSSEMEKFTYDVVMNGAWKILLENQDINTFRDLSRKLERDILNSDGFLRSREENIIADVLWELNRNGYINFGNNKYRDGMELRFFHVTDKFLDVIKEIDTRKKKIEDEKREKEKRELFLIRAWNWIKVHIEYLFKLIVESYIKSSIGK